MAQSNVNHVAQLNDLRRKLEIDDEITQVDVQKAAEVAKALNGVESRTLYAQMKRAAEQNQNEEGADK